MTQATKGNKIVHAIKLTTSAATVLMMNVRSIAPLATLAHNMFGKEVRPQLTIFLESFALLLADTT